MKRTAPAIFALVLAAFIAAASGCSSGAKKGGPAHLEQIQALSLEQRLGQMLMVGFEGKELTPETEQMLRQVQPGSVILFGKNVESAEQLRKLTSDLQRVSMEATGLPLLIAIDQEGGKIVRARWLDDKVAQKAISGTDQAHAIGLARGRALADLGVNLNLAPVLDLCVPGDFLDKYDRGFAGDPEQVGELGAAVISGQKEGGIFSTAKHFPGYGGITFDPESEALPVEESLPGISQFKTAAAAAPELMMTANVVYKPIDPTLPFAFTSQGIDYMRAQVPGDYVVISDDLDTKVLKEAFGLERSVVLAASAGVDILLVAAHEASSVPLSLQALIAAAESGELSDDRITESLDRILELKERAAR